MSNLIRLTIVGDGSSDRCLEPIVQWILDQAYPHTPYAIQYASNLPPPRAGLRNRLRAAVQLFPCDVLIVHRDAERQTLATRVAEIATEADGVAEPYVPAVPVRMIESWLLVDEAAIRRAANNPNGAMQLDIPRYDRWEALAEPKDELFKLLRTATGLNGRRLDRFNVFEARFRLSRLIQGFVRLRALAAFQTFEGSLLAAMTEVVAARQV